MKAMIFAAGLGTRLKPLTDTVPKALVPVGGQPLLHHVLTRLIDAGINDFVINVHHFSDQIYEYLGKTGFNATIEVSDETSALLDTGGGIKKARKLLEGDGWFLAHNVDILSNLDIASFIRSRHDGAVAILAVSERETFRYLLFDDDMRLVGWTDLRTGEVRTPFRDINPQKCRKLAFSGIHLIHDSIFRAMEDEPDCFPIMDFYIRNADRLPIFGIECKNLNILDVGKLSSLDAAEEMLHLQKNQYICRLL